MTKPLGLDSRILKFCKVIYSSGASTKKKFFQNLTLVKLISSFKVSNFVTDKFHANLFTNIVLYTNHKLLLILINCKLYLTSPFYYKELSIIFCYYGVIR